MQYTTGLAVQDATGFATSLPPLKVLSTTPFPLLWVAVMFVTFLQL